jgi:uncharacterized protein YggL (DUF469 family)
MSGACPRLGFELRLRLVPELAESRRIALRAALAEVAESRGLVSVGGGADEWLQVVWREGSQAEHEDRQALLAWANGREEIVGVEAGPIVDLDDAS